MNDTVIQVDSIAKRYRLGVVGTGTLSHDLNRWWAQLRGRPDPTLRVDETRKTGIRKPKVDICDDEMWALKDISFEVKRGEVLGIIGRNGAGKSTLLKILSRVTAPTSGEIRVKGRIASLLEVGTGFHPELTGRENIFLNGAILGMSKAEIRAKFDEIVAFAELDKFIDTPVKRYSSGMYVRLAFAVAAHLEPEILLVDEVLAVGDAVFQKKCLGKMGEVAQHGRTILFVSHNMVAIQSLCQKSIWLNQGRIELTGDVASVTSKYLLSGQTVTMAKHWENPESAPGNELCHIRSIKITDEQGEMPKQIGMNTPFTIETEYVVKHENMLIHVTFHLINEQGLVVLTTSNGHLLWKQREKLHAGIYRTKCHFPGNLLNSGVYGIKVLLVRDWAYVSYTVDNIVSFEVIDTTRRDVGWHGKEPGIVQPELNWEVKILN